MFDSSNSKNILSPRHQLSLHYSVRDLVAKVNRGVLPERQITLAAALSVANREVVKNVNAPVDARIYAAQRAVAAFGSLATKNKVTTAALENSDLLVIGHPMSTKQHAMHDGSLRHARALWVAADSSITSSEVRALVATAHALEPGSIEREHAFARLFAAGPAVVPITVAVDLEPIIAFLGFGLGGNSIAARSLRAIMQRRDRRGRFAFMGGSWSFSVKFPDGFHRGVSGKTIGAAGVDDIEVDVRGSKYLKDGVYTVPAKQGIAAKATLAARLVKNLPEREVSAEQQKYSIDSTALVRKDAPVGWTKIKNANANMSSYTTPDGYRLDVQDNNEGGPDFTADGGAKLYRAVGNTLVKDGVTSWDKIEQQALKDQDAYQKYLDSPEGQKALSSGDWGVDVSEEEISPQGPSGAKPPQGTDVVQQQSVTLNWQTEDGPVTKQGLKDWTEEYAPGVSADLLDDGTVKLTGSETNLRNAVDKATDGDYNATDYIMDSAQKESRGEPTAPVLVDTGASTSADPEIQKMEKAVSGFYDMEYGPGQIEMVNTQDSNDFIYVSDQDDAYNDAKRDGYRDTGKRVPGERIRTRRYTRPSGNTADLDPDDVLSSLAVARQKGDMVRFNYKGVPRVAQPGTSYVNPKNSQLNVRMFDHKKGEERTFAVKDITASKPKQPKPEAAKPAPPSVPGQAVDIPSTDGTEIAKVLNDAIASKSPVRFDYSGKTREFVPERIYTNPKTSKQNVIGFSKTDNEGRTFTLDKMSPPSPPLDKSPEGPEGSQEQRQLIDDAVKDLVEKSLIEPGAPVNTLSDTDSVAQLETSIKKAILDKEDIAFTYHDKPRIVTPAEVVTNKTGKLQVKGFSRTDGEDRTFNIDKINKPAADAPTQVSDIKNMPQAEFDEYVDALWPSSAADAPAESAQESAPLKTLQPKESSAVSRIDYDEDTNEMLVAFKEKDGKGGGSYVYPEVSKEEYDSIASADSVGSAIGKYIKGRKFEKVDSEQASEWLTSKLPAEPVPAGEPGDRYELTKLDGEGGSSYGVANKIFTDNESKFVALTRDSYGWNTIGKFDNLSDAKRAIEELEDKRASEPGAAPAAEEGEERYELVKLNGERGYSYGTLNKIVDKGAAFEAFTRDSYGWRSLGEFDTMKLAKEEITDLEDKIARRDVAPARDSTDDYKEAFDSMFVAPDGTYRPNVFDVYEPVGRRAEQSADYTDDPDVLATRYEAVDLAAAASRGIADGSGDALLDFEAGQEAVPVEAVLEALEKVGIDKESLLAKLYERIAAESSNKSVIDATKKASNDIDNSVLNDPDASVAEKISVAEAAKINGQIGAPGFTDSAFNLISSHNETNPNILSLARDIEKEPERARATSSSEIMSRYLPWAFSNDPLERDAFRAYWGLVVFSDGGDSDNWFGGDYEGNFMRVLARTLGELVDGDINDGGEILDRLTDEYGGFKQFAVGRQRISQGIDDLSAPTTAAALYRLASVMAAPNNTELQRYIFVDEGTEAFDKYTSIGSEIVFDPRSFSSNDVLSEKPNEFFATYDGKRRKLIFRVPPGEMDAFDIHNYSWLPSEQEHVGHGPLKVDKVEKIGKLTYAVDLSRGSKPADVTPEEPAAAPGLPTVKYYGNISSWTRVGRQLGSNNGGTFKDEDGNEYYVKVARSTSHAENEALASTFYKFFNIPASEVGLGIQDNDEVIITPMIPSTAGILQNYIGDAGTVAQLHDGFAIDAWLANYDVAGLEFDNVVVDSNGNAYRIDPGGALMWRAQGKRKDWFGPKVVELDSMRDPDTNYASSTLFGGMSAQQVIDSGRKLLDITPSQIDEIVASVLTDTRDREMLKDVLKRRRSSIFEQLGITEPGSETIDAIPSGPSPSNYVEPVGFEAQDLQPGDVAASDSFVIERIFRDGDTPSGKVSVQGYFPGHESQRKEWNEKTTIEVSRGGGVPPKGTAPALHRPKAPRKPSPGAFNGKMAELLKDAKTWEEAAAIIRGTTMVFFDYETTGLPGPEKGGKNEPVQIGAVKVVGGKVVDRFSSYMNPEHELSDWSAGNLKQLDGSPVTDDWLKTQVSKQEAHEAFLAFVGDGPVILGGQYTPFDLEILGRTLNTLGLPIDIAGTIDSKDLSSGTLPKWSPKNPNGPNQVSAKDGKTRASNSLGPIAEFLQVQLPDWHRADADAEASWEITDAMLTRAIDNPDTPKTLLNIDDSYAETQQKLDEYNKEYKQYEEKLAEYAAAKATAAAFNCGGSGITAAVGPENGPCSVPDIETMIREATPAPIGEIDPDGVTGGSTANETSMSDALEIDDPKYDGIDTNNPYKDESFMPTEEQRNIIDGIMRGDDVVVEALAGTGKTSTLLVAGKRKNKEKPTERGVYIAFNKSAQLEAERKFGNAGLTNIEVVTNDAISYRWAPQEIKDKMKRLKKNSPLAYYKDFAKEFGITEMKGKTLYETVNLLRSAVNQYMISANDELGPQHFIAAGFEGDVPDSMLDIANNIWSDYTSPDGKAKINNTVVTKMWALSKPDLSKLGFGLKSTKDFIFFDEAQDINPVSGKVILDQSVQTVYVGDENQAIYGFRGGENQLAKVDKTVVRLPLTKSFRFGKNIANEGNKWLQLLGSPLRIEGAGSTDGNVVAPGSLLATANAILVRTNSGGFGAIFDQLGRDRTVGVTKNYRDDLVKMTDSAEYLITGQNRPSEMHEELAPFKSWAEVEKAIADEDIQNKKVEKFAELVDDVGVSGLRDLIGKLRLVKGTGNITDTSEGAGEIGDVTPGATGVVGMGVEYAVTDTGVSLSGNTYATRDAIKATKRFSYNGTTKTWDAKTKGEEDTFDLLNNLSTSISGDSGLAKKDTGPIDVMVTTVHQAKGLEWPSVAMWNDFFTPRTDKETGELVLPDPTEQKIAYVAVTRAMENLDLGGLDWINSVVPPSAQDDESPLGTPPTETPAEVPGTPESSDFIAYANERIVLALPTTIKERFNDALEDYADLDSLNEKKVKSFRKKVAGAMDAYKDGQYVDSEEMLRDAAELLDGTPFEEPLKSFLLQAADAADAVRASKATPAAPKTPEATAAETKLDPEWRPSDVAPPQGATPSGTPTAPDDLLPVSDAPKTAGQEAEEKNKAFRSDASKPADLQQKFDDLDVAVDLITGEDGSLKAMYRKRVREAMEKVSAIRKKLGDNAMSEQEALDELQQIIDGFPEVISSSAESIDVNYFRDMVQGVLDVLDGKYYWRPTGKHLPPLDAVDSTGRPVGYSRDGNTFIEPGMRIRDKWGFSGTVEGYNTNDWINVNIRYDIDWRDPDKIKKGSWGPGVGRRSMNPSTLTVLTPDTDNDPWIDLPTTPETKKPRMDLVEKQKKDWAKLKAARDYEAAARAAELKGEEAPPMPPGLALMTPSADLVRDSKKTKANISSYFNDVYDDKDVADSTNDFSLSKNNKIIASDAVITTTDETGDPLVLMISRQYGPFTGARALPGGFKDEGESFEAAADREMMEEVGISADQATSRTYLGEVSAGDWDPRAYKGVQVGAVAYQVPPDTPLKTGDDATGAEWVSIQDIIKGTVPIAFGHATWLAEAFKGTKHEAPLRALAQASKERNARLISQINAIRAEKGFPMFDTPSPEIWTPIFPEGDDGGSGGDLPKADAPKGAPQVPEAGVPSKAEFIQNSYFTEILKKYYTTAEQAFTEGILTQKDWNRIQSYFGFDSIAVNNFLRSGKRLWLADDKDTIENVVKSIDDIFNVAGVELPGDVIVFKGIYDADKLFPFGVDGAKPGDVFSDLGYSSTSTKSDIARTFTNTDETATVLAITVPSGTKMLANSIAIQAGQQKKEQEILLPRGLTFTVTSIKERTKPNKTYPLLPEVYKEIAVTVANTSEAKTAIPEKVEAPEAPETLDLKKVIPTGRPPVRVADPKPLTTSAFQGIMSLSDAVSQVISKKQNDKQLGASALVDAADIEDLDVHVSVTEEGTKEFLQIKFKLTPWAALAQLNKIQKPESPLPEVWDMKTPEITKKMLKDNSHTVVMDETTIEFSGNGVEYVYDDTENNVKISLTSAQRSSGKIEIHNSTYASAPAALHGQIVIRLPIDAKISDIEKALSTAGVSDIRAATKEDAKIVIENKLLSLFKQVNDPTQNEENQGTRDSLLAQIATGWGVTPDDVMLVPGQHGRINYILPDPTARQIGRESGTVALAHSFSLSRLLLNEVDRYYANASPGDIYGMNQGGATTKTFKSPSSQTAVVPEIAQINAVAKAMFNAIKYGLLSSVTRFDVGLQYNGMSNREDMYTGGADYVFFSPKPTNDISYYEKPRSLAAATVIYPAEEIFNRLDMYANGEDQFGRRIPGTNAIEQSKPYGYETVVKHGVSVAIPGVSLNVHPKVRDRVLEMFKEEGITQINGVKLVDLMPILSKFDELVSGNTADQAGAIVADAITSAGGNPDAVTFGEVMALLQLTGAPVTYPYVPLSSKVLMIARSIRATKAGENSDDIDTSTIKDLDTASSMLYVMHPNGNLVVLELGSLGNESETGKVLDKGKGSTSRAQRLTAGLVGNKYSKDIGATTGDSFIAEDTGWSGSDQIQGELLFPAGQKDSGLRKSVTEQLQTDGKEYQLPKTYAEYSNYLSEFIGRYGESADLATLTTVEKFNLYAQAYEELLPLYISDIGSIASSEGASLRAAIVATLLTVRNRILQRDDELPVTAAAESSKLLPVNYDEFMVTGSYINAPDTGAVIEDVDGERAGALRDVYYFGITTTTSDGIAPTGTYVEIETNREGRGGYYLDRGTSVTIDPVTNEIQFSSRGIKYMIRARRPSDEKYTRERAQQDGTR